VSAKQTFDDPHRKHLRELAFGGDEETADLLVRSALRQNGDRLVRGAGGFSGTV
jgi:hypothetical protein